MSIPTHTHAKASASTSIFNTLQELYIPLSIIPDDTKLDYGRMLGKISVADIKKLDPAGVHLTLQQIPGAMWFEPIDNIIKILHWREGDENCTLVIDEGAVIRRLRCGAKAVTASKKSSGYMDSTKTKEFQSDDNNDGAEDTDTANFDDGQGDAVDEDETADRESDEDYHEHTKDNDRDKDSEQDADDGGIEERTKEKSKETSKSQPAITSHSRSLT